MRKLTIWVMFILAFGAFGAYGEEPSRTEKVRNISEIGVPYTPTADMVAEVKALRAERKGMKVGTNADPTTGLQEEPYGIIVNEFVDNHRSRAYFQTTRSSRGAIVIFKLFEFPDGDQKVFPGWLIEKDIEDGWVYQFSLWDGSVNDLWSAGGNISATVYTFNLVSGKFSFLHETLSSWRGNLVPKNARIASASADEAGGPAIRVKLISNGDYPRFFIDGYPVGEKSVLLVGVNLYDVYPPETRRYGGDRLLTVRVGSWCDSVRFRYFNNSAKGATAPPDR